MNTALPNFLSAGRLASAPFLVVLAALGSRPGFSLLFAVALVTDALDGYLARRWHAESELGRKLDSWADYATLVACGTSLLLLWPTIVRREWVWCAAGLGACLAIVAVGLCCWGRIPGYHTWLAKTLALALPFTLVPLLAGWSAVPFHLLILLQVASALEELAIARLLPGFSGEMPSVWHAWARRGRMETARRFATVRMLPAAAGRPALN